MIRVQATRSFTVGPDHRIAIAIGSVRNVELDRNEFFWTVADDGTRFGACSMGDGWKRIPMNRCEKRGCLQGRMEGFRFCVTHLAEDPVPPDFVVFPPEEGSLDHFNRYIAGDR